MRIPLGWLSALGVPMLLWALLHTHVASDQLLFGLFIVIAVVLWLFRLVPDFIPALLVVMLAITLDIVPRDIALSGFTSDVFFMVLGIFFLAAMMSVSGLTYRVALSLLLRLPESKWTNPLILFLAGATLTTVIPSPLGRSAIATPLLTALLESRNDKPTNTLLALSSIHGTTLLSTVFLTGNPLNFVMLGLFDAQTQYRFQWLDWLWAALPAAGLLVLGYLLWLGCYLARQSIQVIPRAALKQHYAALGQLRSQEVGALVAITVLMLGVLTTHWHHIPMVWLAMGVGLSIYLYGGLQAQDMRKHLDWGTLIFIAAIVCWGPMMSYLQLDQWLAQGVGLLKQSLQHSLVMGFAVLALMVIVLRLLFPGAPAFVMLMSALLPVTAELGLSPWVIGFALLTLSEAFILPHQHGVYSQVLSELSSQGLDVDQRNLLGANIWFVLLRVMALMLCIPFWHWHALV